MRIAIYPGSFNPWHKGHADILTKALKTFDKVYVVPMKNPEKLYVANSQLHGLGNAIRCSIVPSLVSRVNVANVWHGLLRDYLETVPLAVAVIRGLRNAQDLAAEQTQQYWNEDLGIKIPFVYFISDRSLVHISSSAIRLVERYNGEL
jgi:pantetheine-phosphate adenylyltransferase